MQQISLFCGVEPLNITKKIRLIELFAGIGAQAKALKNIGADFEHYRICEFDKYAVTSYNAIHGTDFKTSDITKIHASDLSIIEKDKYEYIMTYSFPCTDLSLAGKQEGMAKGSGTRSGLLWEVERLLEECGNNLPQILLMENVDAILFEKNRKHFFQWCNRLEEFGYKNYYQVLNAKDYGIPQNRNRCFMVSILGDYYFEFPKPIKLELCVKDMLEKEVPEKYYLSQKVIDMFIRHTIRHKAKGNGFAFRPITENDISRSILTTGGTRPDDNYIINNSEPMFTLTAQDIHGVIVSNPDIKQIGNISNSESYGGNPQIGRVYDPEYICPAINTMGGGQREPKFLVSTEQAVVEKEITHNYRIRKLMPIECFSLQGFTREDFFKVKTAGISDSQCYKQAGNSIVVDVLEAIFRNMNIKGVKRWQE